MNSQTIGVALITYERKALLREDNRIFLSVLPISDGLTLARKR